MLTEHKLLVHSLRPDLLTSVCEALVSVSATLPRLPCLECSFWCPGPYLDSPYFSFLGEGSSAYLPLGTTYRTYSFRQELFFGAQLPQLLSIGTTPQGQGPLSCCPYALLTGAHSLML